MYTQMDRGEKKSSITILQSVRVCIGFKGFYIVFRDVTILVKEVIVNALQYQVTVCLKASKAYQASIKGHTCPFSVPGTSVTTQNKRRTVIIIHDRDSLSEVVGLGRSVRREVLSVKL